MYHLQLRQFPHNLSRFNLTEAQLEPIMQAWARGDWIELGERKWSPHQATVTVIEGPQLALAQLSMSRGWRAAQRRGVDVTERLLAAHAPAGDAAEAGRAASGRAEATAAGGQTPADTRATVEGDADSLALELLSRLQAGPLALSEAWELASTRNPALAPSDSLALAELAVASLLARELVVLQPPTAGGLACASTATGAEGRGGPGGAQAARILRRPGSWGGGGSAQVFMRRA